MGAELAPDFSGIGQRITKDRLHKALVQAAPVLQSLRAGIPKYAENLGWLNLSWATEEWQRKVCALADKLRGEADTMIVVGVGGSNQAARAVYEALGKKEGMRLVWAGDSLSAYEINRVLRESEGSACCINVIAKNFETLEPGLAFRVLRARMRALDGEAYAGRVVCTGTEGSRLEALCAENGWHFLPFPKDIGGRFSVFSPVALFPLAAAGFDIRALCEGASAMRKRLLEEPAEENIALRYAVIRHLLYEAGFRMEMLSFFEPRLMRLGLWWRQLFAESEGKEGKGLYPLCGSFSEDLHSVGQFLQEGTPLIFETVLDIRDSGASCPIPSDGVLDGFSYLDGMDMDKINRAALEATCAAHGAALPCLRLTLPRIDEASLGALFYYFLFACTLSACLSGVNPFDQPGVEAYKERMFAALGKGKEQHHETHLSESEAL